MSGWKSGCCARSNASSPESRAPRLRSSLRTLALNSNGLPAATAESAGLTHASSMGSRSSGRQLRSPCQLRGPSPVCASIGRKIELAVVTDLLEQIGASDGSLQARQAEFGEQSLQVFSDVHEEANDVLGLAAELGAQLGLLRGDAGRAGVEMTLARHVASESDQHGRAEGEFVGTEQCRDEDVARGARVRHRCAGARGREDRWRAVLVALRPGRAPRDCRRA